MQNDSEQQFKPSDSKIHMALDDARLFINTYISMHSTHIEYAVQNLKWAAHALFVQLTTNNKSPALNGPTFGVRAYAGFCLFAGPMDGYARCSLATPNIFVNRQK